VFLAEPAPTPYDLRFRLLGVDVRVHPLFWLLTVLLGWSAYSREGGSLGFLAVWVACVFASILLHEFGHVLTGWVFGSKGHIVLYSFGGLAIGSSNLRLRWQRILVLLAGPGIQLLLWGAIWAYVRFNPPSFEQLFRPNLPQQYLWEVLNDLWQINLFWPILNLLPIFPLDGGQISREVCQAVSREGGTAFSLGLSMVCAGVLAVHAALGEKSPIPYLPRMGMYGAILFGMLAFASFQALQMENERRRHFFRSDDDLPWER
jgi:Zn-dependent protease